MNRSALLSLMSRIVCGLEFSGTAYVLLYTLKYKDADEVKKLLGKHVIEQHKNCNSAKWKFANYVHQAG